MQSRKVYLDAMRIVAILLVLFNHLPAYHLFHNGRGAALVGGMAMSVLTRINVPLFAMVSGALLLGRTESYADLWRKRISRMLLVIVIFEAAIYVEFHFTRNYDLSLCGFLYGMLGGSLRGFTSYWFLYAYVGFLVMLPFLRSVARQMRRADFLWLVAFQVLITTVVPLASLVLQLAGLPAFKLSPNFVVSLSTVGLYFYPLIGFWIDRNVDVAALTRRQWAVMGVVVFGGMLMAGLATWAYDENFKGYTQNYLGLTAYLTTAFVFLTFKRIFSAATFTAPQAATAPGALAARVLTTVGSLVFGVYLMDQALKLVLYEEIKPTLTDAIGTFGFSLVWCLVSLVICGAATWILKRLPLFRNIL